MRTAHQIALRAADPLQELAHPRDLRLLARMRRARQREVLPREPESLHDAVFDERHCLERLRRGPPERPVFGIAGLSNEAPSGIDDGHVDVVAGLQHRPPVQLNEQLELLSAGEIARVTCGVRRAECNNVRRVAFGVRHVQGGLRAKRHTPHAVTPHLYCPAMRILLLGLLLLPARASGQEASPYVPINHWSMPYVEHLIGSGRMADPAPLSRPL